MKRETGINNREGFFYIIAFLIFGATNLIMSLTKGYFQLLSYCVLIATLMLWTYRIKHRFGNKQIRFYLTALGMSSVLLIILQMTKYGFLNESRTVWYMYYIPLLIMPLSAFLAVLYIGREENANIAKGWKILIIPQLLLIAAVLTNDYHQMVFRLLPNTDNWSGDYSYGVLYYVIAADIALYLILITARVLSVCARKRFIKYIFYPLLVIIISVVYLVLFVRCDSDRNYLLKAFEMPVAICVLSISYFESIVFARLIPTNSGHYGFFKAASIKAGLADNSYHTVISAHHTNAVTAEQICQSAERALPITSDLQLNAIPVNGGYFYWLKDVSEINRVNDALEETGNLLNEENAIIEASAQMEEKKERTALQNRLYNDIGENVSNQLNLIDGILRTAPDKPEEAFRKEMKLAAVYGAFIKRYTNLYLITANQNDTELDELTLSVGESLRYADLCGVDTSCAMQSGITTDSETVLFLYELFETALEAALPTLRALDVVLSRDGDGFVFTMTLVQPKAVIPSPMTGNGVVNISYENGVERITFTKEVP